MGQYVSTMTEQSVFVSGRFRPDLSDLAGTARMPPPPSSLLEPSVAIEILREFNPRKFIGKVYVQRGTEWVPIPSEGASSYLWFQRFQKKQRVYFEMRGSGRRQIWEVEWFRFESSTRSPNPYLAVALQQKGTKKAHVPSAIPGT